MRRLRPAPRPPSTRRRRPPAARSWAAPAVTRGRPDGARRAAGYGRPAEDRAVEVGPGEGPVRTVIGGGGVVAAGGERVQDGAERRGGGRRCPRRGVRRPMRPPRWSASHRATTGPTGASSVTRWAAPANRSTSAPGIRDRRSARKRSWNTGSRPPHSSSVGTCRSSRTAAQAWSAAYDGSPGPTGMSATKSRTAARRSGVRYGARRASRCSRAVIRAVPSTNVGVRRQTRSTRRRATAMSGGTATSSGLATAVLPRTRASAWSGPEAPTAMGPPQSWAARTRGPSTSWRQNATSSVTRSASRRGRPRSDQPIPVWSTAITRHVGDSVVSRSRHT